MVNGSPKSKDPALAYNERPERGLHRVSLWLMLGTSLANLLFYVDFCPQSPFKNHSPWSLISSAFSLSFLPHHLRERNCGQDTSGSFIGGCVTGKLQCVSREETGTRRSYIFYELTRMAHPIIPVILGQYDHMTSAYLIFRLC